MTKQQFAGTIDHTLLKINTTYGDIKRVCLEAEKYHFASVAINPINILLAAKMLKETGVKVCAALAFYLGVYPPELKEFEVRDAVKKGAEELDMLMNVGALKEGRYDIIRKEIEGLVRAAEGRITKVILETCLLTDEEIVKACEIAKECGADFVKTSTGFKKPGATLHNVRLMRETVGKDMGVKAAGGIHTTEEALAMIEAGANRLGVSAGVAIVEGFK
ncbi:MAG: deoxyribose-phosphate aldolase [Candidatus Aerophobetes bacterium]|nr:deoxyribose-phosphate aldolase [Candidatus Aerophobetes bacterium]